VLEVNNGSRFWDLVEHYSGSNGDWEQSVYPLAKCDGQTIRARFRFVSSYNRASEGWYVDDLLFSPHPGTAEPGTGAPVRGAKLAVRSPAFRAATIAYALPAGPRGRLAAYNADGRRVAAIAAGLAGAGQARWDLAGLQAGAYFIRLTADAESKVSKVVVSK
jgi:hypothetical protein